MPDHPQWVFFSSNSARRKAFLPRAEDDAASAPAPVRVFVRDGIKLAIPEIMYPARSNELRSAGYLYKRHGNPQVKG